ncbi:hypothetical protein ACFQFC_09425 [Amorphoplanes digitatis]|uniref:Leucine-rich repeat domain-containing protein n=1 Tax=Actinoplanes digitatis TaxID=1868 RepID=A0A7W7I0Y4_9ACTN|nr:hypothetical protein [Actinoplanes digitatis]MBB4764412.1 hypothetical protein [Actinoplanes digitatis]BFE73847.1 hypothetical protein GCM10020092_071480 [Actinoplanes digitatis]GID94101.1 hypothetical protein Adi01nite_35130 [Actinoplanes digitatis]
MRMDYDVLTWDIGSGPGVDDLPTAFIDGGYDGIYIRIERGVRLKNLDFLGQLPGLKYVEVKGAVRDDSHAFSLSGVVELVLLTRSKVPLPVTVSDTLESLGIDDRPGVLEFSGLARLQHLTLWLCARRDLQFLSGAPGLLWLKVEGLGQVVNLSGIENCRLLLEVELLEIQAESLSPLGAVQNLLRLRLIGSRKSTISSGLNLDELCGLSRLRELRITNSRSVQSVEPLLGLPEIQDVRMRNTRILDPDAEVQQRLSRRGTFLGPDD